MKDVAIQWSKIAQLAEYYGNNITYSEAVSDQMTKLTEELGEVAQAWIGVKGQNKRKGVYATGDDVAHEIVDVIVTASVMLATLTVCPDVAFEKHYNNLMSRCEQLGLFE